MDITCEKICEWKLIPRIWFEIMQPDNPPEFGSKVYEMMALALAAWRAASENLHSNHQISSSSSQGRKKRQSRAHLLQI
jgi:hypothetical protein